MNKDRIHYLAELAVDNGECAAQAEIKDQLLRESLILNVEKQMQRAVDEALNPAQGQGLGGLFFQGEHLK